MSVTEFSALAQAVPTPEAVARPAARALASLLPAHPWDTLALMDGRMRLAGHEVTLDDAAPFTTPAPSLDWARELHGFAWLRHLVCDQAADEAARDLPHAAPREARAIAARHYVSAWVESWLESGWRKPRPAFEPAVMAARTLAWLRARPALAADGELLARTDRALRMQRAALLTCLPLLSPRLTRLRVTIALAAHALAFETGVERAFARLDAELDAQILPDGGHISRNPSALPDLLLDLLPLRDALLAAGAPPSPSLNGAIDRMMPMLSFFRHGDGAFASLGGAAPLAPAALAALSGREEAGGAPVRGATHSGYHRASAGGRTLLIDAGMPAPSEPGAPAGAASFEFSDEAERIVVNCGVPHQAGAEWAEAARATAAHSTLCLADCSSAPLQRSLWRRVVGGDIGTVEASRGLTKLGERIDLRHTGYAAHGVTHCRTLALIDDGAVLQGCDSLELTNDDAAGLPFAIRFHLHPRVTVGRAGQGLRLLLPSGKAWTFLADRELTLEDSACVTPDKGLRGTRQIVVTGKAGPATRVRWRLARA